MELRHLRYFVAVAEHRSVRTASSRVHVTQPAISRQIRQLEDEIGTALFERTSRGLILTAAGEAFLAAARQALSSVEAGVRSARQASLGLVGTLRIGFVENAGWAGLVPDAIGRLQREAPGLRLELRPLTTPAQIDALESGNLDGGFVYLFDETPPGFVRLPLFAQRVALAVPDDWDIAAGASTPVAALAGRPFVTFSRHSYPAYYDRLIAACRTAGLTMDVVQEAALEPTVLSLVSAGLGAAIVNSANRDRPPARVRFLELEDLDLALPLSFVYRAGNDSPALARLLRVLEELIAERVRLQGEDK